ncbi:hypothetical protein OPIT5_26390 [Opitutaceae bacterium TAV5]|nr:hypothetical protein OPIT5_26390 [Opitutaceae bacterium TAV5]
MNATGAEAAPAAQKRSRRVRRVQRRRAGEPGAIDLLEEAAHLLREAPAGAWALYFTGAGAWVLGFLFFWAHASWRAPSPERVAWYALGLVALFAGLKLAQAIFCEQLMALRTGRQPRRITMAEARRITVTQLRCHGLAVVALPVAALLMLPFCWVWAFYQNLGVLGASGGDDAHRAEDGDREECEKNLLSAAREQAALWPAQNHVGLVLLSLVATWVLAIVAISFFLLPWLAGRLLGVENFTDITGWSGFNTTAAACVVSLAWLVVDPLVKAFYTLRVFYGRSRRSGEDLLVALADADKARRRPGRGAATGILIVALTLVATLVSGTQSAAAAQTGDVEAGGKADAGTASGPSTGSRVDPGALDRALDEALRQDDFVWQLPPAPAAGEVNDADRPWLLRVTRQGIEWLVETVGSVIDAVRRFVAWIEKLLGLRDSDARPDPAAGAAGLDASWVRILLYVTLGLIALLVVWGAIRLWQARRQAKPAPGAAGTAAALPGVPDLADDSVQAAQLPADGWELLAREKMTRGEWRLALRALYLASLARLGTGGWLALARHKTNADYETELRRRAAQHTTLVAWFSARRREFEAVWYGRAAPDEQQVRGWLDDIGRGMTEPATDAGGAAGIVARKEGGA